MALGQTQEFLSAVVGDQVEGSARAKAVAFRLEEELEAARLPLDKVKRALRFCGGGGLGAKGKGSVLRELC